MSLSDTLLAEGRRPHIVGDLVTVVDEEIKSKKGISGTAIKTVFAAARKANPTLVESATNRLLPDFLESLEPFWEEFNNNGDFGDFLAARGDAVANALLAVTDRKAEATSKDTLRKAYSSLRSKAADNVKDALPRVGRAIEENMR